MHPLRAYPIDIRHHFAFSNHPNVFLFLFLFLNIIPDESSINPRFPTETVPKPPKPPPTPKQNGNVKFRFHFDWHFSN